MSGETEQEPSGWTPDLLYLHLRIQMANADQLTRSQIDALAKMLDERYATQTKALDAAFLAQQAAMNTAFTAAENAVSAAMTAAEKAVDKANTASEKRFESVNEFRAQLNDTQNTLLPRIEAEQRFNALDARIVEVKTAVDKGFSTAAGGKAASQDNWGYLVGAVGIISVLATLAFMMVGR